MKCKFPLGCLLLSLASANVHATSDFYVNDGVVLCPPQIPPQVDATNFVNNNFFNINFTNFVQQQYQTAGTWNYTNNGVMIANGGFRFDTAPTGSGTRRMAASFVNNGTISAGSAVNNTNLFAGLFFFTAGLPKLQISATNVSLRSSTNIVGADGLFSLAGKNVDLNRAHIQMEGFDENPDSLFALFNTAVPGLSAEYWGIGTNVMNPAANFEIPPPRTPPSLILRQSGFIGFQFLTMPAAKFYVQEFAVGTNRFVQAVFLSNTNDAILNNVYFPNTGAALVEWLGLATNQATGVVTTNHLYLSDTFGSFASNSVVTNFSYYSVAGTAIPVNYQFTRFNPYLFGLGAPFPDSSPAGVFDPVTVTNQFAAFGAVLSPTSVLLASLPASGRSVTNMPGRVEITADHTLDLSFAEISALNYLRLKATNNISGMGGAAIVTPNSDINLATTNGSLAITNLLYPTVQRFTGTVDLWSGRWTNDFGGFNTRYSVLFVDSKLNPTAPSLVQDLTLRSTNVVISDVLNVTHNLMIEAERLTLVSNVPPAVVPTGQLNLLSSAITWPGSTPRLQFLTNNGSITALNSVFFGGSRTSPFFTSNYNEPYLAFVNRGTVTTEGSLIWANYFENSGQFGTGIGFGSISLQSIDARLTNGGFVAVNGDVSITSGSLSVTNHLLQAGRVLTLSVTNNLTDTGFSNANSWVVGRGFNMPVKPVTGDLLGTTITETAQPGSENTHLLAGQDRGADSAGFSDNAALGRLVLDGRGPTSLFSFTGAGTNNALYVDYLDLRNFATNIDLSGNLTGVGIAGNMRIYYGQAVAGGTSVAERLNHANGDRLRWVASYAGIYSATNLVYPDGTTNAFNAALVQSCNQDSDGDGLVNCSDPTPILRSEDLGLTVTPTNVPSAGVVISWQTVPSSSNTVLYKTSSGGTIWTVLTNFVVGPVGGTISVFDPMTSSSRFYRVELVMPPQ